MLMSKLITWLVLLDPASRNLIFQSSHEGSYIIVFDEVLQYFLPYSISIAFSKMIFFHTKAIIQNIARTIFVHLHLCSHFVVYFKCLDSSHGLRLIVILDVSDINDCDLMPSSREYNRIDRSIIPSLIKELKIYRLLSNLSTVAVIRHKEKENRDLF